MGKLDVVFDLPSFKIRSENIRSVIRAHESDVVL